MSASEMDKPDSSLKRTPLFDLHRELGARMMAFAGYEMPIEFRGVVDEHLAVRTTAGLFDVSHMGEFFVEGPEAESFLQALTPNDVSRLSVGQAQYSALTTEAGTFVDDLLVSRLDQSRYLVVVNASNVEKDFAWMESRRPRGASLVNASEDYALLALQGPNAEALLSAVTDVDLRAMKYYRFAEGNVFGTRATVSRTGYTGEDGFEILIESQKGE
ncbi:MAG TPA: glycine cleavage system aminomethyltransferase GcvT, partial [Vicinamibacteria bacterium]